MITGKELALSAISEDLSRIRYLAKKGVFVVLSAYRGNLPVGENQERNARLFNEFRKHGLGGIQLVGHFVETINGKPVPVQERSFSFR